MRALSSASREGSVDGIEASAHERRLVRGQPGHERRDLVGLAQPVERVQRGEVVGARLVKGGGKQRRADDGRADTVDPHTPRGAVDRSGTRDPEHAMLGRDIRDHRIASHHGEHRRHVHDRPGSGREHVPQFSAQAVIDAAQVDVDHLAPVVDRILLGTDQRAADTGDVGGDVQRAIRLDGVRDRLL